MKLVLLGELPSLNEYIQAERGNKFAAAKMKKLATESVAWECRTQKLECVTHPAIIKIKWYMKNKKKDIDNVSHAVKYILDGLVVAGILYNDNQEWVKGLQHEFHIDKKNPRIEVSIL
jgi:Holliday junction resolvase RusA-like endonuclease